MVHRIIVIEGGKRVEQKPEPSAESTARKIAWCREHIPGFAAMQDRAIASKNGTIAGVKAT